MTASSRTDILEILDGARRASGEPSAHGNVVREFSLDGSECRIVYSQCTTEEIDDLIYTEISLATAHGYALEWKTHGHDVPSSLAARLVAAGFEPSPRESVLALDVNHEATASFAAPSCEIRRVDDKGGLDDVADIAREIGRTNVEHEQGQLALVLDQTPADLSIYVAYVGGEPVASGRIEFPRGSAVAWLAGGRTKTMHRNRGLFIALVGARLREALARRCTHVFVDARPASESILRKRGFRFVTHTQPFLIGGRGSIS